MNLSALIRQCGVKMMLALMLLSTACDSAIYDYEGDCSVSYRLRFRYDMNMAFADAFAHEVNSVNVYAFNNEGVLVWQNSDCGEILRADDYTMTLDLPSGKYDLIAWCGLNNQGRADESFDVPQMQIGVSTKDQLTCRLNRKLTVDGQAFTDFDLYRLYHGGLSVDIIDENDPNAVPGTYDLTMNLTKNTNRIRIILQQLSGEDVNPDDFAFTIEDNNGLMNFDNSLLPDQTIYYRDWQRVSGTAGVDNSESESITKVNLVMADITVARMMEDHDMMLTITNVKNNVVFARIPLIDYALLVKGNYEENMSNQEYLDRQDQFTMTFFMDEDLNWLSSIIYINSWRVVLDDVNFE